MEPLTIRVREERKESLESEANEYEVSVSEHIRDLIEKGYEYDDLEEQLERRKERIETLEEQLARRSQVEEKIDTLARRQEGGRAPFFIEWYQWWKEQN